MRVEGAEPASGVGGVRVGGGVGRNITHLLVPEGWGEGAVLLEWEGKAAALQCDSGAVLEGGGVEGVGGVLLLTQPGLLGSEGVRVCVGEEQYWLQSSNHSEGCGEQGDSEGWCSAQV